MKHTPGPWKAVENKRYKNFFVHKENKKEGGIIAIARVHTIEDAKLISAAPDMLQLLLDLKRQIINAGMPAGLSYGYDNINALLARLQPETQGPNNSHVID